MSRPLQGKVKFFNGTYGFITYNATEEIFVHRSDIANRKIYLQKNELVRFEKGIFDGRLTAKNVRKLHVSQQTIICTVSQILDGYEETARGKFAQETFDPGSDLQFGFVGKNIEDYPIQELRDILRLMPPPCATRDIPRQIRLEERLEAWQNTHAASEDSEDWEDNMYKLVQKDIQKWIDADPVRNDMIAQFVGFVEELDTLDCRSQEDTMLTDMITAFKRNSLYASILWTQEIIETGQWRSFSVGVEKEYQGTVNDKFLTLCRETEPDCHNQEAYEKLGEIWEALEEVMGPTDEGSTHVCTVVLYCDVATVGNKAATVDDVVDWGSVDLVGMFTVHTDYEEAVNAYVAYGSELVVSEEHRGVGNGKGVVNYADNITMKSAEMLAVYHYVYVEAGNIASISTFESCGYTRPSHDIWPHIPSSVIRKFREEHEDGFICLFKLPNPVIVTELRTAFRF
jgi:cold shock CspA family protein/GNAT superfamily N-acetyltransferase